MKATTLVGQTFGRLHVEARERTDGVTYYWCTCLCGTYCKIRYSSLKGGHALSCGCYFLEVLHRRKQPDAAIRLNSLIRYYKRNAKIRDLRWGLSKETVEHLVTRACEYCGWHKDWCGIDRVNNAEGYRDDNCVPCCRWCNWSKNGRTLDEFKDWVRALYGKIFHG